MDLRKYNGQLDKLNVEIAYSLTVWDSVYTPEQLSAAINGITAKIGGAKLQLEAVRNEMAGKKASMEKVKPAYERFCEGWDELDGNSIYVNMIKGGSFIAFSYHLF